MGRLVCGSIDVQQSRLQICSASSLFGCVFITCSSLQCFMTVRLCVHHMQQSAVLYHWHLWLQGLSGDTCMIIGVLTVVAAAHAACACAH
jgi:hypothetical protein